MDPEPKTTRSPFAPVELTATIALFLRLLALVYVIAFVSLAVQVQGLVGSQGILPVATWLDALRADASWTQLPTLLWLSASDAALSFLAWGGAVLALVAAVGWARGPLLAACWVFYLSLVHGGQDFLSFQWDALLLETGFLALFVAPWGWRREAVVPSRLAVWLLRLLVFKLMLSSGLTKLTWGDPTWANLTALEYHYWTQPLPNPLAWFAAQLPDWVQRVSCFLMFVVELGAPFGAFGPRRLRLICAAALVGLQGTIAATGNYGFFNVLSIVLCVPLLDDRALATVGSWVRLPMWRGRDGGRLDGGRHDGGRHDDGRRRRRPYTAWNPSKPSSRVRLGLTVAMAALTGALSVTSLGETVRWSPSSSSPFAKLRRATSPFMIHSGYGLFRVMTTTRPEIEIEVSEDGSAWRAIVFPDKPGPLNRHPPWVAPHMPRLDWQMWFAALSAERLLQYTGGRPAPRNLPPWLLAFAKALVERQTPVLDLLEDEAGRPRPLWIRMTLYQYRFAGSGKGWWLREEAGVLLPPVRLEG